MNVIELKKLNKTFGNVKAVNELDLNVPRGSIYGFIGPNGSGKTTTIRMIMKIMYPDSGDILINGMNTVGDRPDIGYLPEDRGLYKKMKVGELLRFHSELSSGSYSDQEISSWLKKLDLDKNIHKKVETLSKGMRQKLQFIATIIGKPEIIILDEPFSGLDPVNADMMKDVILELRKAGATIIFSTHDMAMAEKMCDYIFMIYNGKKVLDGTLSDIQDQYGSDTIRIQTDHEAEVLSGIPGIQKVNDFGKMQEIRLDPDSDTQKILSQIMKKAKVLKFEITKPSLHDIFVRIASPDRKEVDHE